MFNKILLLLLKNKFKIDKNWKWKMIDKNVYAVNYSYDIKCLRMVRN